MKTKYLRLLSTVLAFAMIFALCACGNQTAKETVAATVPADVDDTLIGQDGIVGSQDSVGAEEYTGVKEVKLAITDDWSTLAPYVANNNGRMAILPMVYQGLYTHVGFEAQPCIASGHTHTSDTTTEVTIRDDVYDSEGNQIKASDVVFSINAWKEAGNATASGYVEAITALDEFTVEFTWSAPLNQLGLFDDIMCDAYIISEQAYIDSGEDMMATAPVGTGPYKVTNVVLGSSITLEAVENFWWSEGAPARYAQNVDVIHYDVVPEASQVAVALERGDIDMSASVALADLALFSEGGSSSEGFSIYKAIPNLSYYVIFNASSDLPTGDVNVRRALAYSFDADGIVTAAFGGAAKRVYSAGGNEKFPDYNPEWTEKDYYSYNTDAAKDSLQVYLDANGLSASDISLKLICGGDANQKTVAEMLQSYFLTLGINVEINTYDSALMRSVMQDPSAWDICINQTASNNYAVMSWRNYNRNNSKDKTMTGCFIVDDKLQELAVAAQTEPFSQEQVDELHYYAEDEMCYALGLCHDYTNMVHADWVTGLFVDEKMNIMPNACTYDWLQK